MDTTAIPEFKIAKVGKDRKRKGGGLPFFGGGSGGGGAFSGAVGGSGAAAGAGLIGKIGVLALIGTLSAGAWQFGKALRPDETGGPAEKPKLFASHDGKYSDEDLAGVIRSNGSSIPNSMGYVKGSMDGMTAEERAKKEAEAAEAARLAEEEAKKAEAEAAAKEPANVAGAPAGMDPNALMQNTGGDKKEGAFGKKFGALSSSFGGGGLAGGAGLAGGVNRGFSNATLKNKGSGGKMASMKGGSNPSISKGTKARAGASNNKGFARRQLGNAFSLSRQASSAGKGETAAQTASSAFDNNNGAGNVISGPGVGAGTGGAGMDAGGSVNPNTGGSAINPNDEAAPIANNKGKNVTKYQGLINAALALLALVAILAAITLILEKIYDPWGIAQTMANILKMAMMAVGAIVALLGVAIMAQGQYLQGGILTAVGGFMAVMAYTNASSLTASATNIAQLAATALVSSAVGMLAGVMGGAKGGSGAMN